MVKAQKNIDKEPDDDQYGLENNNNKDKHKQLSKCTSMKALLLEAQSQQGQNKVKPIKKQSKIKKQTKNNSQHPKNQKINLKKSIKEHHSDQTFKYIKNQKLQSQLKSKTLKGVLKVLNLISQHRNIQKQQQQE